MPYYSPHLPLTRDKVNGYKLLDDIRDVVKQNFKMLILTNPGERIMIPDFGVGIYKFLFEPYGPDLNQRITEAIKEQSKRFMPFLNIRSIQFGNTPESVGSAQVEPNSLNIVIEYHVPNLNFSDVLNISANVGI
tara:strand:+ start:881 stop:1282 length:402 start_codon:yes stop_codon:yes gene_type:complete